MEKDVGDVCKDSESLETGSMGDWEGQSDLSLPASS